MSNFAYNEKVLDKIADLKQMRNEAVTHSNSYHGSSKDECIYCGEMRADESQICPVGNKQQKERLKLKLSGGKALLKHLRTLPKAERPAVASFLTFMTSGL